MKVITSDIHSDHSTVGIFGGTGRQLFLQEEITIRTSIAAFRNIIEKVGKTCTMVIEEGSMASWLTRNLSPCIKRFIVAEPKHNSLIYKNPNKGDSIDIMGLATLYATGNLRLPPTLNF